MYTIGMWPQRWPRHSSAGNGRCISILYAPWYWAATVGVAPLLCLHHTIGSVNGQGKMIRLFPNETHKRIICYNMIRLCTYIFCSAHILHSVKNGTLGVAFYSKRVYNECIIFRKVLLSYERYPKKRRSHNNESIG